MENKKNKNIKMSVGRMTIVIIMLLIVVIGGTFAWLTYASRQSALVLTIGDLNNAQVKLTPYQFRGTMTPVNDYKSGVYSQVTAVNNSSSSVAISFYYYINNITTELIENGLKYTIESSDALDGEYQNILTGDFTGYSDGDERYKIADLKVASTTTIYYRVYLWLDSNIGDQSVVQNSILDVELNANIYTEPNAPVLSDGMIPVTISNDGVVTTVAYDDPEWYDYENKEWANMVLVTDSSRSAYRSEGVTVSDSDILAYYVWIPRYKYKIIPYATATGDEQRERSFVIQFEAASVSMSNGTTIGSYKTHPAFWWDNDSDGVVDSGETVAGIWVGKFETTGSATTPTILPNVKALTAQTVSEQFTTSRKFSLSGNPYGLSSATMNSHMMKNSEWGAVAYLSHSEYGIDKEVYINNSSYTYTGRSGGNVSASVNTLAVQFPAFSTSTTSYNSYGYYTWTGQTISYSGAIGGYASDRTLGTNASTTGNVTGVYDMAGGSAELVMANYGGELSQSGFSVMPDGKYYDLYSYDDFPDDDKHTNVEYCTLELCGGHSLNETMGWYGSEFYFAYSDNPWFERGGNYLYGRSMFYAAFNSGYGQVVFGFRSVLVPYEETDYTLIAHPNGGTLATTTGWTSVSGRTTATKAIEYGSTYGTLPTVTRSGYTFNGWSTNLSVDDVSLTADSSLDYVHKSILSDVYPGVTYMVNIGEATLVSGSGTQFSILAHDFTTSTNYGIANCNYGTDVECQISVSSSAVAENNLQLLIYAGVTGETGGNTVEYTNITVYGNSAGSSNNPDSSTVVSLAENQMIFANWDTDVCTVTYYNGTTKLGTSNHTCDSASTLTTFANLGGTVTNSSYGWEFYGWSEDEPTLTKAYGDGASITLTENKTVYSIYNRSVTFKSGVSAGTTNSTVTQYWNSYGTTTGTYLSGVTSPALTAVTNWTSKGWRNDATASTLEYNPSTTVYPAPGGSNTLYGVYERTLTFKSAIAAGTTDGTSTQYLNASGNTVSSVYSYAPADFSDDAGVTWTSTGYRDDTDRSSQEFSKGTSTSITPAYTTANTLYAVYKREYFVVSFNCNGGSGSTSSKNIRAWINSYRTSYYTNPSTSTNKINENVYIQNATLPSNGCTKTGYTFNGWKSTYDGTLANAATYGNFTVDIVSGTTFGDTLVAQWKGNSYTIAFSGASADLDVISATYGSTVTIPNPSVGNVTLSFSKGLRVSNIGSTSQDVAGTFKGWYAPLVGSNAQYSSNGSSWTSWDSITDYPTVTYFRNLTNTSGEKIWFTPRISYLVNFPSITGTDLYTCVWTDDASCVIESGYPAAASCSLTTTNVEWYACCGSYAVVVCD